MSLESVKEIIGKAVMETEFRDLLFDDPDKALEGFDLTDEETAALKALEREKLDEAAEEMGERVSRAGLGVAAIGDIKGEMVGKIMTGPASKLIKWHLEG
jgi:hypothetical protein